MANLDRPRGFECKGIPLRVNKYQSSAACYPGDFVTLGAGGQVAPVAAGGVILGLCLNYVAASGSDVIVADHPDQLYVGQCDAGAVDAQTDIGNTADIKATGGNSTYKASRQEFDDATLGTSTAQLLLLGIEDRPNNALGANVAVIVRVNKSQMNGSYAGI